MNFEEFIQEHAQDDPVKLLLARERWPEVDVVLAASTLQARAKLRAKVPAWYAAAALRYPSVLAAEQCSSSATARYKASLAAALYAPSMPEAIFMDRESSQGVLSMQETIFVDGKGSRGVPSMPEAIFVDGKDSRGGRIADLTGGMGVDSWAFAEAFSEVLYNEADATLADAARCNFGRLGAANIRVHCGRLVPEGGEGESVREILGDFVPEVLFLDPARRGTGGRKVFRLQDCTPDVLSLLGELLEAAPHVLMKLSPMMDISLAVKELNQAAGPRGAVTRVDVVAASGECKELLVSLERDSEAGKHRIVAAELGADGEASTFAFLPPEEAAASPHLMTGIPQPGGCLFEPGKALTKAGAFNLLCRRYSLAKWGLQTHLYAAPEPIPALLPLGKWYRISEILPLGNRTARDIGRRFPKAEVTTRNLPFTADDFRRKSGCTPGGDTHLFALRADFPSSPRTDLLLVTTLKSH